MKGLLIAFGIMVIVATGLAINTVSLKSEREVLQNKIQILEWQKYRDVYFTKIQAVKFIENCTKQVIHNEHQKLHFFLQCVEIQIEKNWVRHEQ